MQIFGLGTTEIILILVILLFFFGKDKLPELAKSIGTSFKELKKGFAHDDTTDKKEGVKESDGNTKKSK